jgi:hypothetical protein
MVVNKCSEGKEKQKAEEENIQWRKPRREENSSQENWQQRAADEVEEESMGGIGG